MSFETLLLTTILKISETEYNQLQFCRKLVKSNILEKSIKLIENNNFDYEFNIARITKI